MKYFGNEEFEARRYDENLRKYEDAATRSESSLGLLNIGQSLVIAAAVTALMLLAEGVVQKSFTLGDLVLGERPAHPALHPAQRPGHGVPQHQAVAARHGPHVPPALRAPRGRGPAGGAGGCWPGRPVAFHEVDFFYEKARQILYGVSFTIEAGQRVAVVGHSGSGKSTLARLLYRFYDASSGSITINGRDVREVKQASLRAAIGIVPQDTVLFNDTILYNIRYGRPEASDAEVVEAAPRTSRFHRALPAKYETMVGERGLKLSGRKSSASPLRGRSSRTRVLMLSRPPRPSTRAREKAIQAELERISKGHHFGDRPPAFDGHGRRRHSRAAAWPHRRARYTCTTT